MPIYWVAFLAGLAALVWEILWLHFSVLVIGVSAQAAAIVLSVMMFGIALGSWCVGPFLKDFDHKTALRLLALLEVVIGVSGVCIPWGFQLIEKLDVWGFRFTPDWVTLLQYSGIALVLGVPAFLMGATIPVYARIAERSNVSLTRMYAANIAGASVGILAASFVFIPIFTIAWTIWVTAGINVMAALLALTLRPSEHVADADTNHQCPIVEPFSLGRATVVVFCTGFVTFALEVLWFRALRAALQATTESFALILFVTLIALAFGSYLSEYLRKSGRVPLAVVLALGSFLVFETTPLVERFDLVAVFISGTYEMFMFKRFLLVLAVLGPPMAIIGIGLPWIMEVFRTKAKVNVLYAFNTLGAVAGSLAAAWVFLPTVGLVKGAWIAGGVLTIASLVLAKSKQRMLCLVLAVAGVSIAFFFKTEVGTQRVQGVTVQKYSVLAYREGVDVNTAVIEDDDGVRQLYIDGYSASSEDKGSHYMQWMGRLPMLLHPSPVHALVICFGTGQTANGLRQEGVQRLDLVDVNDAVFDFAPLFVKNEHVLSDPRVQRFVMDGRAFLRRMQRMYDVVTLEPMPPTFAGSNALYSFEFYQLVHARLTEHGVAAQWLPLHLVDPKQSAAIVAAFRRVFPNAILWIDPVSKTGIILGSKDGQDMQWYGFQRQERARGLSQAVIEGNVFGRDVLKKFTENAGVVTDNNQFLSYGYGRMKWWGLPGHREDQVLDLLNKFALER